MVFLTLPEYALAMHLIKMKLSGQDLPTELPAEMVPAEHEKLTENEQA